MHTTCTYPFEEATVAVRVLDDSAAVGALQVEARQERLERGVELHCDGDALEARVVADGVDIADRETDLLGGHVHVDEDVDDALSMHSLSF